MICVSLRSVLISELGTLHQYEALSYHWGDKKEEHPIHFRDVSSPIHDKTDSAFWAVRKRIFVRPNLYAALQHLRQKDTDIDVWVDAICINQDNEEEKKAQVARMWEIYSKATRVCIWLGPTEGQSDHAMKFIREIVKDLGEVENLVRDRSRTQNWHDLAELLMRAWFSRRWVIQELALAKDATVLCGNEETSWDDFKDAISLFVCHFDKIRKLFKKSKRFGYDPFAIEDLDSFSAKVLVEVTCNIFRKDADGELFEPTGGLEYLVSTLCVFDSSDPRDTIVALRNIARETSRVAPTIGQGVVFRPPELDYKKNLLEVYTDFVRWVLQTSKSLDIICRHWALPEKEKQTFNYPELCTLPSWIQIMWEGKYGKPSQRMGRINGDSFVGLPGRKLYDASHGRDPEFEFGVDRQSRQTLEARQALEAQQARQARQARQAQQAQPARQARQRIPISATTPRPQTTDALPNGNALNHPQTIRNLVHPQANHAESATAEPVQPSVFDRSRNTRSLYVKGLQIGKICWKSSPVPDGVIHQLCLEKAGWNSPEQAIKAPEKLWRTLVADRGSDGSLPPGYFHRVCLHCLVNDTQNGHINTKELLRKGQPTIVHDYLKRVQAVTWNRVFFEADASSDGEEEKLFGLGPPKASHGDVVCVLFGCSVPVILRKRQDKEDGKVIDYFEFVGEAYVYGKMDGEAVTRLTEEELKKKLTEFQLL
jgi:hypothetical protein